VDDNCIGPLTLEGFVASPWIEMSMAAFIGDQDPRIIHQCCLLELLDIKPPYHTIPSPSSPLLLLRRGAEVSDMFNQKKEKILGKCFDFNAFD
jgi:hypothetical protein